MITTQTEFRAAIFDPEMAIPVSLTDGVEQPAGKRFNIYRNKIHCQPERRAEREFSRYFPAHRATEFRQPCKALCAQSSTF